MVLNEVQISDCRTHMFVPNIQVCSVVHQVLDNVRLASAGRESNRVLAVVEVVGSSIFSIEERASGFGRIDVGTSGHQFLYECQALVDDGDVQRMLT